MLLEKPVPLRVFDCVIFNGEIDLLLLRLRIMYPYIEEMLIIEAGITFSGIKKASTFKPNSYLFDEFSDKINYHFIEELPFNDPWQNEHYLRDQLRHLTNANDEDVITIADTDEIINVPEVINKMDSELKPATIKLNTYYYYLNCKSNEVINVTLISKFKYVKGYSLGNRSLYHDYFKREISGEIVNNGGHFTYQFGSDVSRYIKKIRSFSHQEFNKPYFLNQKRIKKCVKYLLDLYERDGFSYSIINKDDWQGTFLEKVVSLNSDPKFIIRSNFYNTFLKWLDPYFLRDYSKKLNKRIQYLTRRVLEAW